MIYRILQNNKDYSNIKIISNINKSRDINNKGIDKDINNSIDKNIRY